MKTTKSFGRKVLSIVNSLYKLQEDIQSALDEYDDCEVENENGLTDKQAESRDALQEEYDEIQNAIDYLEMFVPDNI